MKPSDARTRLLKRISSRMSALARQECERGAYQPLLRELDGVAPYLTVIDEINRAIWDFGAIVSHVFPEAFRHRSRQLRTMDRVVLGRPIGPIRWPLTIKIGFQSRSMGGPPELVCRETERHPETPENLLLVETLRELEGTVGRLERERLVVLSEAERRLVGRMRQMIDRTNTATARDHVFGTLTASGQPMGASVEELERRLERRLVGPRPPAPLWADTLLRFRRRKKLKVPADIPRSLPQLYGVVAILEVLLALSEGGGIDGGPGLDGALFAAVDQTTTQDRWGSGYVLRHPVLETVFVAPIFVLSDEKRRPDIRTRLKNALWRHPTIRSTSRWLVIHPGRVGILGTKAAGGIEVLEVSAPLDDAPSVSPSEIYRWLAAKPAVVGVREAGAARAELAWKPAPG